MRLSEVPSCTSNFPLAGIQDSCDVEAIADDVQGEGGSGKGRTERSVAKDSSSDATVGHLDAQPNLLYLWASSVICGDRAVNPGLKLTQQVLYTKDCTFQDETHYKNNPKPSMKVSLSSLESEQRYPFLGIDYSLCIVGDLTPELQDDALYGHMDDTHLVAREPLFQYREKTLVRLLIARACTFELSSQRAKDCDEPFASSYSKRETLAFSRPGGQRVLPAFGREAEKQVQNTRSRLQEPGRTAKEFEISLPPCSEIVMLGICEGGKLQNSRPIEFQYRHPVGQVIQMDVAHHDLE